MQKSASLSCFMMFLWTRTSAEEISSPRPYNSWIRWRCRWCCIWISTSGFTLTLCFLLLLLGIGAAKEISSPRPYNSWIRRRRRWCCIWISTSGFKLTPCFLLLLLGIGAAKDSVQKIIAAVGESVTLQCQVPNYNRTIDAVFWMKPDLEKSHYVLLLSDGHIDPEDHHDIYKNRVELKDRTMKDGDVSLIVKEVTFNDSGTFHCFIQRETNNEDGDNKELITSISLSVVPGDPEEQGGRGRVGLIAGLTVAALVVGIFVVLMLLRHQKKKKNSPPPAAAAAPEQDTMLHQVNT